MSVTTETAAPEIVDHEAWRQARAELLVREKAHTREGDAIAAARRRQPMTEVPNVELTGPDGPISLLDIFEGRNELVIYQHMFHNGLPWEDQCPGCTLSSYAMQDAADSVYLNANGITFAILADGPYEEISAFREFMGYTTPWYSNLGLRDESIEGDGEIRCYVRRGDRIFLTSSVTDRGCEAIIPTLKLLDMTAYGRREEWEESPAGWPQRPTFTFWRTEADGTPVGWGKGRPALQWTRPGVTATAPAAEHHH